MTVFFLIIFPPHPHSISEFLWVLLEKQQFSFVFLRKDLTVFRCASDWPGVYHALVQSLRSWGYRLIPPQ